MATITVTTNDGAQCQAQCGASALDALKALGRFNRHVIAARVDGRVVDLAAPLTQDCAVVPISVDSPEGLEILRHSTAHLMAQAVKRLFPQVQITIGPTITD